jgi:hypothetical protein
MNRSLEIQARFIIGFLVVQYLLGMFTNMFVAFPEGKNEGQLWQFAWTQPSLIAHIIIGIGVFISAVILTVRATKAGNRIWTKASWAGLVSILVAIAAGSRFIPTQTDGYSFVMSVAFIAALLSYGWGLYSSRRLELKK